MRVEPRPGLRIAPRPEPDEVNNLHPNYERQWRLTDALGWRTVPGHEARTTTARRRYVAAIRALAQVRRRHMPAVQVNIGEAWANRDASA